MTFDEIISRLNARPKGAGKAMAKCPAHDDKNPSLSISAGDDGKTLLKCFAGCSFDEVIAAAGIDAADLSGRQNGGKAYAGSCPKPAIVATYDYTNSSGNLLYQNVKYATTVKDDRFKWRRHRGAGGWIWNLAGVPRVPYRLPELIAATATPGRSVFLAEGEKDADALRALGFTATNSKNWQPDFNQYLAGAHVAIFRDHDGAGRKIASDAAKTIAPAAASVKIVDLFEGEPEDGQDVSDWIGARQSAGDADAEIAEALSLIVEAEPEWQEGTDEEDPAADTEADGGAGEPAKKFKFIFTPVRELIDEPPEDVAWVWDRTLPAGGFSMTTAKPKTGKSTVARSLAAAVASGEDFLGRATSPGPVLYLCLEEKRSEVARMFREMRADGEIFIFTGRTAQKTPELIEALAAAIAEHDPVLVVIDPLSRVLRSADFNDYAMAYALEPLIDLARRTGTHVMALHHDGKGDREGGDAILGSTALFGAVDCHLSMKKRNACRTIASTQRYGVDLPETIVELDPATGAIVGRGDLATAVFDAVKDEILAAIGADALTMAEIRQQLANRNGGQVSKAVAALVNAIRLSRTGSGKRGDPYLFRRAAAG